MKSELLSLSLVLALATAAASAAAPNRDPIRGNHFRFSPSRYASVSSSPPVYHAAPYFPSFPSSGGGSSSFRTQDVSITIPTYVTTSPSDQAYINANYKSSSTTYDIHSNTPRFGYTNDISKVTGQTATGSTSTDLFGYAIGLGILAGICLFLALVTLFTFIFFSCCRCCRACGCCKCCAGSSKKPVSDAEVARRTPFIIVMVIFCVGASAAGIVGVVYSEQIYSDVSGDSGFLQGTLNLLQNVNQFIINVSLPCTNLVSNLGSVSNSVTNILNSVNLTVANGFTSVTTQLMQESTYINGYKITLGTYVYPCDYCTQSSSSINAAVTGINDASGSTLSSMQSLQSNIHTQLLSIQQSITDNVNKVLDNLSTAQEQVQKNYYQVKVYTDKVKTYDGDRRIGFLCLLLMPCLFLVLGGLGVLFRRPLPYRIIYWFSFLVLFLVWLVCMITLPLSASLSDQCVYIDSIQPNIYAVVNNTVATVFTACLTNAQLTGPAVFNLSYWLNFSNSITFPPELYTSPTTYLNFQQFTNFTNQVNALTPLTFGFDPNVIPVYLAQLDAVTSQPNYWEQHQSSITYTNPPATGVNATLIQQYRDMIVNMSMINSSVNTFLTTLKQNVSNIQTSIDTTSSQLINAQTQLQNTKAILAPVQQPAIDLQNLAYCGFVGDNYKSLKNSYCNNITYKLGIIAMVCFMIAVFTVPILVITVKLADYEERLLAFNQQISLDSDPSNRKDSVPLGALAPSSHMSAPLQPSSGMAYPMYVNSGSVSQPPAFDAGAPQSQWGPPPSTPPPDSAQPMPVNAGSVRASQQVPMQSSSMPMNNNTDGPSASPSYQPMGSSSNLNLDQPPASPTRQSSVRRSQRSGEMTSE